MSSSSAMAEPSKDELLQLIKRFGDYLTVKMSNLFTLSSRNMDSLSVGAIVGLAVAIAFAWRLLPSPSIPQRKQPKRPSTRLSSSGVDPQANTSLASSGIASYLDETCAQNVVDDFFQPVKPML